MGKTVEALDNENVKSLPQAIFTATSLLIEWMQGQNQDSELDEMGYLWCKNHDRIENEDYELEP